VFVGRESCAGAALAKSIQHIFVDDRRASVAGHHAGFCCSNTDDISRGL